MVHPAPPAEWDGVNMSITMNTLCIQCLLNKHVENARSLGDEKTANAFTADLLELLKQCLDGNNSAVAGAAINKLYQKHFGLAQDRYVREKRDSNEFVKSRLPQIGSLVEQQGDPVFAALQFAILGNYLDFSALRGKVSFDKLDEMLADALNMELDRDVYKSLCADLEKGEKLLYITDNAGEIGFDRVFAQQLQKKYPRLQITFCVRGKPAHNDAMREDAAYMELEFPVVDTGNDIGGIMVEQLSRESKEALDAADVIIAKGMGNTESMYGCGYNVYYAFLVKCTRFQQVFNKEHMTPMLVRERK